MKQFLNDYIHMTQGELLVNYWWLWLGMVVVLGVGYWYVNKKYS